MLSLVLARYFLKLVYDAQHRGSFQKRLATSTFINFDNRNDDDDNDDDRRSLFQAAAEAAVAAAVAVVVVATEEVGPGLILDQI